VELDQWVVMPNHLHAIITLKWRDPAVETCVAHVSQGNLAHVPAQEEQAVQLHPQRMLQSGSLGSIINQFKGACTKRAGDAGFDGFAWQPRFFEHVIRDEEELGRIRSYIQRNPARWEFDSLRRAGVDDDGMKDFFDLLASVNDEPSVGETCATHVSTSSPNISATRS